LTTCHVDKTSSWQNAPAPFSRYRREVVLNTWMESLNGSYPFQPFVLGDRDVGHLGHILWNFFGWSPPGWNPLCCSTPSVSP